MEILKKCDTLKWTIFVMMEKAVFFLKIHEWKNSNKWKPRHCSLYKLRWYLLSSSLQILRQSHEDTFSFFFPFKSEINKVLEYTFSKNKMMFTRLHVTIYVLVHFLKLTFSQLISKMELFIFQFLQYHLSFKGIVIEN